MPQINTVILQTAVGVLSKIAAGKSTMPVIQNVAIASTSSSWWLAATDLEITVVYERQDMVGEEMATTVPASTFGDIVKGYDSKVDPQIKLTLDKKAQILEVKSKKSKSSVKGIDYEEFPPTPRCSVEMGSIPASVLKTAITRTVFATSNDKARPVLGCIALQGSKVGNTYVLAADGFRLAIQEIPIKLEWPEGHSEFLLSSGAARKLMTMLPADKEVSVSIATTKDAGIVQFSWGDFEKWTVYLNATDGKFPDWKGILPNSTKHEVLLPDNFNLALKQAEIFGEYAHHIARYQTNGAGSQVTGSYKEMGKSVTTFDVYMPIDISFNSIFMQQGVETVSLTGKAILKMNTPASPMLIANKDQEYRYILMPMRDEEQADADATAKASVEVKS